MEILMRNKIIKPIAFLCAAAMTITVLAGCSDRSWAVSVDGTKMPTGVYLAFLLQAKSQVQYQAYTSSGTSSNPWSQQIEGTNAKSWAENTALKYVEEMGVIENLCKKRKLSITPSESSLAANYANSQAAQEGNLYSVNGVSNDSVARISQDFQYLQVKLFNSYYSTGGDKAVPTADLQNYYLKNYVRIKHIVIKATDSSGSALTGAALKTAEAKANSVLKQANSKNFDSLMKRDSDDVDSTTKQPNSPDGYVFSKYTAQADNFDTTFVNAALSMKNGEIKMVKASYGYDIMYKIPVTKSDSYLSTSKTRILYEMKQTDFQNTIDAATKSAKIVQNKSAINHYDPSKLKDESATSTPVRAS